MALDIITAAGTAPLAALLADRFDSRAADPFATAVIVVPTRGVERYLTQVIADRAGVCANIDFLLPRDLLELLSGGEDPWRPERSVWPLLAAIADTATEPWAEPIAAYLRDEPDRPRRERRYALAAKLAGLFDRYATERPTMVRAWEAGDPSALAGAPDLMWQYHLWRSLRERIGQPQLLPPQPAGLPEQIAIFGPTRLPERTLAALRQLALERTVEVYLPIASPQMWDAADWPAPTPDRAADTTRARAVHPLLRSLGRDLRELRQRLGESGRHLAAAPPAPGLLGALQHEIVTNSRATTQRATADASVQVHACHGALRQVEVLREVLLTLLQDDPTLQPRDVLVMTPDLDTYAPLLAAVFGDPDPRIRALRLSIADRSPQQHNEVVQALDALLSLLHGRMRRSEVLDLLQLTPVRAKFDLSAADAVRLEELAEAAQVRWGMDRDHRKEIGSGAVDLGSWSWGLDRLALGTALSDDPLLPLGDTLPLPDVAGGDLWAVGRLAVLLDRLAALQAQVRAPRTLTAWNELLQRAIGEFTQVRYADAWQDAQASGTIEAFVSAAGAHADRGELSLTEVRQLLAGALAGRPTRAGFRLGGMTACRLEPMRSVPYRVIALVGMDEGAFPRAAGRDGDDLLLRQPLIGEQDPRSEDRQLLLDAVVAAQQHLVITYSGRDERTNSQRHPAVPLAELMDVLPPDVVQQRPLQPFDWREFAPPHPFSHDQAALAGARVSVQERVGPGVRIGRLPEPAPDAVPRIPGSMRDLTSFLKDPFEDFLRRRFGLRSVRDDEAPPERLPLQLSGLDGWLIGDEGLRLRQTSGDGSTQRAAAIRGGAVPPGAIGEDCLQRIDGAVEKIHQRAEGFRGAEAREITVPVPWLPDEQTTIADVYGNDIVHSTYSKKKPGQLLQIWPQLLCLGIARPDEDLQWFLVAKGSGWRITVPDRASCQQHLDELLAVYATGATAPVPVPAATAHAYVHQLRVSRGSRPAALAKASGEWSDGNGRGDGHSSAAGLLYGQAAGFEALLADRPGPDESWYGPAVPSRFEAVARRVWEPILQHSGPLPRKPPQKTVSRAGKRS